MARKQTPNSDVEVGDMAEEYSYREKRAPSLRERLKRGWARMSQPQKAAAVTLFVVTIWMGLSLIFTYFYYYQPMPSLEIPGGLATPPSVCGVNVSCLFAVGGADSGPGTFLPAVEAFNGTTWGSEQMLPPNKFGTYGYGLSTGAVVLAGRIYAVGHSGWGDVHSYDGSPGGKWRKEPGLNFHRGGLSLAVYRGRIYAIGGKTLCKVVSVAEDPDTSCSRDGWILPGDHSSRERSDVVESFDPRVDSRWRVECSMQGGANGDEGGVGDAAKCLQIERSGHVSTVYKDKIIVVGGQTGFEVELFDGTRWSFLEQLFPTAVYGASMTVFQDKIWVIGGLAYTAISRTVYTWDGRNFQRKTPVDMERAWASAAVFPYAPLPNTYAPLPNT
ncbi:hypothetical protein T484DRAFT_2816274 [Baffinella frigidus]|nr:hypothetical protein T484DRAFT_2816274 [Cryptophyta sp. CCMP2293]